jgi:hypothetical protein
MERPSEKIHRGDAPAAAHEPGRPAGIESLQAESPAQGAETIDGLAFLLFGQESRPLSGDPKENLKPIRAGVVQADGPAEERVVSAGRPDHEELTRDRPGGQIAGLEAEQVKIAPTLFCNDPGGGNVLHAGDKISNQSFSIKA